MFARQSRSEHPQSPNYLVPILFLAGSLLWLRLEDIPLFAVDSVVYCEVAKLLSRRPVWEWAALYWNGVPYYEHPPLMKWVLAYSIRILGSNSLAGVLPSVIFSTLTVGIVFQIARELWDDRYALVTGLILCLFPSFIRDGRNPMLEPPLIFFIFLAVYFGIVSAKGRRVGYAWISGVAIALAWLTKGPPALIAFLAIAFITYSFQLSPKENFNVLGRCAFGFFIPLILFEIWHHLVTSRWFVIEYFRAQIFPAASAPTPQSGDILFYLKDCFERQWPWLLPALAAPWFVIQSKDVQCKKVFYLGILLWVGPLFAFSFFPKKSSWYANLTTPALAMVAAIPFQVKFQTRNSKKIITRLAISLGVIILFLGATLPSVFRFNRPIEDFFHRIGQTRIASQISGAEISDCLGLDPWKGPFFVAYYLDSKLAKCDSGARLRLEHSGKEIRDGSRIIFQTESVSLLEKQEKQEKPK